VPKKPPALSPALSLLEALVSVSEPRSTRGQRHPLVNIIVIAVLATICGADSWVAIQEWANAKRAWLAEFLDLASGIPSHDTFGRVFSILDPEEFQKAFTAWTAGLRVDGEEGERVVAIDGKTLRRSHDAASGRSALHLVNAWSTTAGVCLGQLATAEKSNEITAIPELLKLLWLRGAIVTIDAMGCQKKIAEAILEQGADYLLAVKDNQPTLAQSIKDWFDAAQGRDFEGVDVLTATQESRGHGRQEERNVWIAAAPADLPGCADWPGLRTIVWAESCRVVGGKTSVYHRFYISSSAPEKPEAYLERVRSHWSVENQLHWVLDMAFREDESRVRLGHAAENMGRLRQIALNLLKQEKTSGVGVKNRRLRAGWDNDYLLKVLGVGR
jgi:predicted transposase YbfD/YdcC